MRANIIMGIFCVSEPKFQKPLPDPNKIDRITYREVINEWREIAFKKIDQNVLLMSENKRHENTIKRLKAEIKELKTNDTKN